MKNYLSDSGIKEKSIIMIDFEGKRKNQPFWVDSKSRLHREGVTILYGALIKDFFGKAINSDLFHKSRIYTSNTDKDIVVKNSKILGLRELSPKEKMAIETKIRLNPKFKDFEKIFENN